MKHIFFGMVLSAVLSLAAPKITAQTLNEAREMYRAGDFGGALPTFLEEIKKKPKDAALNQWVGVCLMQEGRTEEAIPYLTFAHSKGITEAPRYLAEIAFHNYEFDKAAEYIDHYENSLKKSKKSMPDEIADLRRRVLLAGNMLERVEKIVVIDSVAVDREEFFKNFRLSHASGSINSTDILPEEFSYAEPTTVYMPETKSMMLWSAPDENDNYVLMETERLFDGSWETPKMLDETLNLDGDNNYPFLMPDGITLYYANNGDGSIGGYDIFISRKDDNGFLQPQNIGMPYNSPYDDYLLAIDEVTGAGWWATDRNQLEDEITIYKFIPADLRENYPTDSDDLTDKARITDYKSTWEDGKDYITLLEKIDAIKPDRQVKVKEFSFALPGGRVYTSLDDFRSREARRLMEEYVNENKDHESNLNTLQKLREKYRRGDRGSSGMILDLEKQIERERTALKKKANEIITYEN